MHTNLPHADFRQHQYSATTLGSADPPAFLTQFSNIPPKKLYFSSTQNVNKKLELKNLLFCFESLYVNIL